MVTILVRYLLTPLGCKLSEEKIDELAMKYDIECVNIIQSSIKPKKSDIEINQLSLVWWCSY